MKFEENFEGERHCPFAKRKVVYIVVGLTGSGKSSRVSSLVGKYTDFNLKCKVIRSDDHETVPNKYTYDGINGAVDACFKELEETLNDHSVRRIFLDDCNLHPNVREGYIDICERHQVEWVLLVVGKFTREFADQCARHNLRGISKVELYYQLSLWGKLYGNTLKTLKAVQEFEGVTKARAMRDTMIIAYVVTPSNEHKVILGLDCNGSYRRGYTFKNENDAETFYQKAISIEYQSYKDKASWFELKPLLGSFKL